MIFARRLSITYGKCFMIINSKLLNNRHADSSDKEIEINRVKEKGNKSKQKHKAKHFGLNEQKEKRKVKK
jgi:hypothetical protein